MFISFILKTYLNILHIWFHKSNTVKVSPALPFPVSLNSYFKSVIYSTHFYNFLCVFISVP